MATMKAARLEYWKKGDRFNERRERIVPIEDAEKAVNKLRKRGFHAKAQPLRTTTIKHKDRTIIIYSI